MTKEEAVRAWEDHLTGVAVSVVVRDAIDASLPATTHARTAAVRRILEAAPMEAPGPDELRAELEELRGRRG